MDSCFKIKLIKETYFKVKITFSAHRQINNKMKVNNFMKYIKFNITIKYMKFAQVLIY